MKMIEIPVSSYHSIMVAEKEINRLAEFLRVTYPHQIRGNFMGENPVSVSIRLLNR